MQELIKQLKAILESKQQQFDIIKEELDDLTKRYADKRRTEIIQNYEEISYEDLITEEEMVITISHGGFIKRFSTQAYKTQHRGGRGVSGATIKEEDFIEHLFVASTHDYILFFTDRGKCHWLKVYYIPQTGKTARGRAIINLIDIEPGEKIQAFVTVREFDKGGYITMATQKGIIKKSELSAFSRPRKGGIIAINIREEDQLINAQITSGEDDILIVTRNGKSIRFNENDVRAMGRNSTGVKAITLKGDDAVISMATADTDLSLLILSENGYGKRTRIDDFRLQKRGGSGIIAMKITEKTGNLAAAVEVGDTEDVVIITEKGIVIRQRVEKISIIGRNTQGVRMIRLDENDKVSDMALVIQNDDEKGEENE